MKIKFGENVLDNLDPKKKRKAKRKAKRDVRRKVKR